MFHFIYARSAGEEIDPAALLAHFDDVETDGVCARYVLHTPVATTISAIADEVNEAARRIEGGRTLLVCPTPAVPRARQLWLMSELVTAPNVKIHWSLQWGGRVGQSASVAVPTLNHRLGAVRIRDAGPETLDCAKRLAGIGFNGLMVIDVSNEEDGRMDRARRIVQDVRDLLQPPKPTKAPAGGAAQSKTLPPRSMKRG